MRAGTRRLLLLTAPSPARYVLDRLGNAARLRSPRRTAAGAVLDDAIVAAVDALIAEAGGPAWDEAGFARLRGHVAGSLAERTLAIVDAGRAVLDAAREVERLLEPLTAVPLQPARADVARAARAGSSPPASSPRPARRGWRRRALPARRRAPARAPAERRRRRPRPHERASTSSSAPYRERLHRRRRGPTGAARGAVDARGAARGALRAGARHARAGVGQAHPPRAGRRAERAGVVATRAPEALEHGHDDLPPQPTQTLPTSCRGRIRLMPPARTTGSGTRTPRTRPWTEGPQKHPCATHAATGIGAHQRGDTHPSCVSAARARFRRYSVSVSGRGSSCSGSRWGNRPVARRRGCAHRCYGCTLGAVIAARTAGTRQKEQLAHEERRQTEALECREGTP